MSDIIDISIDLETLGKGPDAAILAIGIADSYGVSFSVKPSVSDQIAEGRRLDDDTLHWWFKQSDAARDALVDKRVPAQETRDIVLRYFREAAEAYEQIRVWGNSPSFDCEILASFLGTKPWRYHQERDIRTARDILGQRTKPRIAHTALADAEAQLEDVRRYRQLAGRAALVNEAKGGDQA